MKVQLLGFAAAALLAGCNKAGNVDLKHASVDDVVKATVTSKTINPGQWSVSTEVISVDMPGLPEKQKAMMSAMTKAMVGKKQINESCVTKAQAEKPPTEMFSGKNGAGCSFDKFSIDNGEMNAVMKCSAPGGGPGAMTMTMAGQFGGDSYDIGSDMTVSGMGAAPVGAAMTVRSHSTGKRTGDCKTG